MPAQGTLSTPGSSLPTMDDSMLAHTGLHMQSSMCTAVQTSSCHNSRQIAQVYRTAAKQAHPVHAHEALRHCSNSTSSFERVNACVKLGGASMRLLPSSCHGRCHRQCGWEPQKPHVTWCTNQQLLRTPRAASRVCAAAAACTNWDRNSVQGGVAHVHLAGVHHLQLRRVPQLVVRLALLQLLPANICTLRGFN